LKYPTNILGDAPRVDESISFGGAGGALAATASVRLSRATWTQGGPVGTDAGAETGPYATVASGTGTGARRALAEELFAANYPKLAGWVRRLVDDDDTAHEIASEAFVRLLSKWTSPAKLDNPQSYLYMIATNLVRDHWRKLERERRAMRTVGSAAESEPFSDPAQDVDVRELLQGLPARLRDPFLLHYYAGFGIKEISALLKRPEGTIKADLYHARARLKEALAEREADRGPHASPGHGASGGRPTDAG
jgi:RNA polymerase sigma-70 factor (ECF subfamily)